jgi:hypothetical protein
MNDLRNIWQNQEVENMKFSVEELRAKAAKFQQRIRRRNLREYVAALVVMVFFGAGIWKTPEMIPRISYTLLVAAMAFYAWYLRRWGSAKPVPAEMGSAGCANFYRHELARQRDLLRSFWKWGLLPVLPGVVLLMAYSVTMTPAAERWHQLVAGCGEAAIFSAVIWMNAKAARRLDRRVAELDRELGGA